MRRLTSFSNQCWRQTKSISARRSRGEVNKRLVELFFRSLESRRAIRTRNRFHDTEPKLLRRGVRWWGVYLFAAATGGGWTILSSVVMRISLLRVPGVTLLEQTIVDRPLEYASYQTRTNAFFLGPPKGQPDAPPRLQRAHADNRLMPECCGSAFLRHSSGDARYHCVRTRDVRNRDQGGAGSSH